MALTFRLPSVLSFLVVNRLAMAFSWSSQKDPDVCLPTTELIKKYDYPVQNHAVTTEDGYILELHRIPFGRSSGPGFKKTAVLLMHGLFGSSADWIIMGPKKSLGYILADLGYDVWMGNSRGNTFSRKHKVLDPNKSEQFWNFSWHELGVYDTPAVIDYILKLTGQPKLFYIGHSQGTTQFYVMASERPEYNDKIRAMFSLAPVAYMSHAKNPLMWLAEAFSSTSVVSTLIGSQVREFLPHSHALTDFAVKFCSDGRPTQFICKAYLGAFFGLDFDQMNATTLPVLIGHNPEGISTKQIFHYTQGAVSGKFRKYDYGQSENLKRYGRDTPPPYDLNKISAPVALHYSQNDWLADVEDVELLYNQLPNPIGKFLVPYPKFSHMDFLYATHVKALLYDQMIRLMEKH